MRSELVICAAAAAVFAASAAHVQGEAPSVSSTAAAQDYAADAAEGVSVSVLQDLPWQLWR